jgi:hypothetical protein
MSGGAMIANGNTNAALINVKRNGHHGSLRFLWMIYCGIPAEAPRESIMHSGDGHHSEAATTDANNAWAQYVNALVHQSMMDALHAVSGEFAKLIADVNGDFNKNVDIFDAKIKAAIASCECAAANMRSNIPAMIDEALAKHVARAMANIRQPADGTPGPAGPTGMLEKVRDHVEGQVCYERDLVVAGDGALYQAERDTAATPPDTDWRCITRAGRDGKDALNFRIEGTYDSAATYRRLSIVTLNGSSFVARHDDPGPCPGDGWQLFASAGRRGQQGQKGERGERGPTGPLAVAPRIVSSGIDAGYNLTLRYTDGATDTIPLRPAFEQFFLETGT